MKFAGKEIDLTDVDFTRKSIIWTKPDESPASGEQLIITEILTYYTNKCKIKEMF